MSESTKEPTPVEPPPLPPEPALESRYQGVRGWLLFFCIVVTVLNPLLTGASLITGFGISREALKDYPGLLVMIIIDTVLSLGITGFGLHAGIRNTMRGLVSFAIWFSYLGRSKRVRATYSSSPFPAPGLPRPCPVTGGRIRSARSSNEVR